MIEGEAPAQPTQPKTTDWDALMKDADATVAGVKAAETAKEAGADSTTQISAMVIGTLREGGVEAVAKLEKNLTGKATPLKEEPAAKTTKAAPVKTAK